MEAVSRRWLRRLRTAWRLAPAAIGAVARPVAAHSLDAGAHPHAALPWSFEPWVLALLALSAALYAVGLWRLWRHAGIARGVEATQAVAFAAGWGVLVVALVSPLDPLGGRLFSAHMVQHELLMIVAAPLLVLGRPLGVWAWALPLPARRGVGGFFHRPGWRVPWRLLTGALAAWIIHALALWLWHLPMLFEAALHDEAVHALQHTAFLLSALVFWWSVFGANTRRAEAVAMLSLFTTMVHSGALGALLTLARTSWYPSYALTAPAFGLSALDDQQLGGLVMWIPASVAYIAGGLVLVRRWLREPAR